MSEVSIIIKTSNADKTTVSADPNITIWEFKKKISESLSVPPCQMRLIYKGRVLKDESTLEQYQITEDGQTIHMVKSGGCPSGSSATTTTQTPAAAPAPALQVAAPTNLLSAQDPFAGFGGMGAMGGLGGLGGFGGAGGAPNMAQMQEQMMRNPQMMQQMMNSPMMESLMNNPELMRSMMLNNPQMQQMLDANPQIRHVLNDPQVKHVFFSLR
jgi:ubiquilin